jgi:hypothetical protein
LRNSGRDAPAAQPGWSAALRSEERRNSVQRRLGSPTDFRPDPGGKPARQFVSTRSIAMKICGGAVDKMDVMSLGSVNARKAHIGSVTSSYLCAGYESFGGTIRGAATYIVKSNRNPVITKPVTTVVFEKPRTSCAKAPPNPIRNAPDKSHLSCRLICLVYAQFVDGTRPPLGAIPILTRSAYVLPKRCSRRSASKDSAVSRRRAPPLCSVSRTYPIRLISDSVTRTAIGHAKA